MHTDPDLDPQSRAFLDRAHAGRAALPASLDARMLRLLERASIPHDAAARATLAGVEDRTLPDPGGPLPIRLYHPQKAANDTDGGALVFFHGGGFVLGDLDTHDSLCADLAAHSGCLVIAVAYRLAPEHPFPAQIADADAALRWVAAHAGHLGIDPARLAVGGDSAGGNLAANCCLMARDRAPGVGAPPIAFQLLLYPLTHRSRRVPSEDLFAEGYLLTDALLRWFRRQHRPQSGGGGAWPYDAPFEATDHRHLPPALIITAGCDPLRDQGSEYAAKLREAGVAVELINYPRTIHNFMLHAHVIECGRVARRQAGDALRRTIGFPARD